MTLFELVDMELTTMIEEMIEDGKISKGPMDIEEFSEVVMQIKDRLNDSWVFDGDQAYTDGDIQDFLTNVHDYTILGLVQISLDYIDPRTGEGTNIESWSYTMQEMYRNILMVIADDEDNTIVEDVLVNYVDLIYE